MSPILKLTLVFSIAISTEALVHDADALLQSDILVGRGDSAPLDLFLEVCTFVSSFLLMTMGLLLVARWARDKPEVPSFARFLEAVEAGDLERSRALLRARPDFLFARDGAGATALHLAAAAGASDVVKLCLSLKGEVDARDSRSRTPLHLAARTGELCCLIALVDAGADLEAEDFEGKSPVLLAAEHEQAQVCRLLLDHGCCPEVPEPPLLLEELLEELYHVPICKAPSTGSLSTGEPSDSEASRSDTDELSVASAE